MLRSFNRGDSKHGPIHSDYRPSSGRSEYRDAIFGFNPYTCVDEWEDFHGYLNTHPLRWKSTTVETAGSPTAAVVADAANGEWKGTLAATNELESARLDWGDNRNIDLRKAWMFEAYVKVPVAITTAQTIIIGLAHDHNATFDSNTHHAWFRQAAAADILVEVDDAATDQDDLDTTRDQDTSYHLYTIIHNPLMKGGSVFFFLDKDLVYTVSGVVWPAVNVQPYIAVHKASGTGVPAVTVDFVRVFWERF